MRYHKLFFAILAFGGSVFAQDVKPVAERLAVENALFEEQYESDLRNFPERATAFGDYRYNDKLADYSLDAITKRHKTRSEEHTSELQSQSNLVCRLLLEKKKKM